MVERRRFTLVYARAFADDMQAIDPRYHSMIRRSIEDQLTVDPDLETRNRKPLARSLESGATWELRLGRGNRFRVFFRIEPDLLEVHVLAVGRKERNRLIIGGEEVNP